MDISSVENFFRRIFLAGVVVAIVMTGMFCLKIIKAPAHHAKARSTPAPLPDSLDMPVRDSGQQAQPGDAPLTTFVLPGKIRSLDESGAK